MKKYYIIKYNHLSLFRDTKGELSTRKANKLNVHHDLILIEKTIGVDTDITTNAYTFDAGVESIWRERVGQFVVWDYTSPLILPLIHIGDKVMTFAEYKNSLKTDK